tara:strand:- start:43587 stop:44405 length:819 start_codon:yes stop_codon:yes gene_type:complete
MNISVLGCGWLGFPLAQRFLKSGHRIKGSTTSENKLSLLNQNGIDGHLIEFPNSLNHNALDQLLNCDVLFLNIPPSGIKSEKDNKYQEVIHAVTKKAADQNVSWIIFVSSTSVYNEMAGFVTEKDADIHSASKHNGKLLLESEKIVQNSGNDFTILRMGGLYGYGRHPIHYLSGKKNLDGASKPVNLIHQVDCLNIISDIVGLEKRNTVYNLVSDGHPPRKEFYESAAKYYKLDPPKFKRDSGSNYKVVSNEKVKMDLNYTFSYPNPMDHTP